MKLSRVTKNAHKRQKCYIVGNPYFANHKENYSIARSIFNMITLQNDHWKRSLIKTPKEYL